MNIYARRTIEQPIEQRCPARGDRWLVGQVPRGHTRPLIGWALSTESIKDRTQQRCLQSAWGGLGRQTDRPKLIEDYSKPEILHPIHRNLHRDPSTLEPSTKLPTKLLDFRHTRLSVGTMTHGSQFPFEKWLVSWIVDSRLVCFFAILVFLSSSFRTIYVRTIGYSILTGTKTDAYIE